MKASLVSKIIVLLCIISLVLGFLLTDKQKSYEAEKRTKSGIMAQSNKVAVLELEGTIAASYESGLFSKEANAANLLKSLQELEKNNEIKGIIIKINSPGGTVAMSQNIYNKIMKIRANKPVVAVLDDVAASGGYYIACAADRIIAEKGTLTGSVGVIFSLMDYHQLLKNKLDISPVVIKSGKFKDIGSSTREMLPEERELLQDIVNDSYNQFVDAIRQGRIKRNDSYSAVKTALTEENLITYADGRVFTGVQAKKLGFVDETGDMDTAKIVISSMLNERYSNDLPVKLIQYKKTTSFNDYFSGLAEYNSRNSLKLTDFIPASVILSRKPLYLWE